MFSGAGARQIAAQVARETVMSAAVMDLLREAAKLTKPMTISAAVNFLERFAHSRERPVRSTSLRLNSQDFYKVS